MTSLKKANLNQQNGRKPGQALLLAILLMLFVSLLGVTFITVVALNLEQTGRAEDEAQAKQAARAGLEYAENRLTNSEKGLNWRPGDDQYVPPSNTDPNFATYYTPFERAQGWGDALYAKWPSPNLTTGANEDKTAPTFLLNVERETNPTSDKYGALKITSIGLSPTNQNAFEKVVAYKGGYRQMPLTANARTVTNWDFDNNVVPQATVASTAGTSVTVNNVQGTWPATPFYITIGTGAVRYAVVTGATATTLTLSASPSPAPSPGERIEVAAALGAPDAIDYNNDGTSDTTAEKVLFPISQTTTPGSVFSNGGLIWFGNVLTQNLVASAVASSTEAPGAVRAAGLFVTAGTTPVTVSGKYSGGTLPNSAMAPSSADANFPGNWASLTAQQKAQLVDDGLNRIAGNDTATVRQIDYLAPPDITSGGEGLGRYRQLTKYSQPASYLTSPIPPQAAAYGYGEGIYISNTDDVEKKYDGANGFVSLSQTELMTMLYDAGAGTLNRYRRAATPAAKNTSASLEEQHLRGWIAPDEFLPRGALVEINADGTLTITLDSRKDGTDFINGSSVPRVSEGPNPDKGWNNPDGTRSGDATWGGVYRRANVAWPANGIVFAEGNIRIRGEATTDPGRSLTVVSMNNIYLEGSLSVQNRKVLLLAKKNVVVNPTRVMSRVDAQTRLAANVSSGNVITVRDGSLFAVGDRIEIGTDRHFVTNITGSTLTLSGTLVSVPYTANTDIIRVQTEPTNSVDSDLPFYGNSTPYLGSEEPETQVMPRRFHLPTGQTGVRLAMVHGGEERMAYSVQAVGWPAAVNFGKKLGNPAPGTVPSQITAANKIVTIDNGTGTVDTFPGTPSATITVDDLINQDLAAPNKGIDKKYAPKPPDLSAVSTYYNASVLTTGHDYSTLPYYALAGVGLRHQTTPTTAPGAFPWTQDIKSTAVEFPIATSVQLSSNGQNAVIRREDGSGGYVDVNQFGYNPDYTGTEDALTVDRSFYSTLSTGANAGFAYPTIDSRVIQTNLIDGALNTLVWRYHDDVLSSFNDTGTPMRPIPRYGMNRVKLENLNQFNASNQFETLAPGYTFNINAYVYAQEGSWLVVPGPYFDSRLKTTSGVPYLDLDGSNTKGAGESLDLNRDGIVSRAEQVAVYRFLRYNYEINFNGSIMEKSTPLAVDPDGTGSLVSPVAEWTNKWATVKTTSASFGSGTFDPSTLSTAAGNFGSINYAFDSTLATDPTATYEGLHLPVTPGLIYQTG